MSTDCWITVENKNRITIEDFRKLVAENRYPAGSGDLIEDTEFVENKDIDSYRLTEPEKAYHVVVFGIFLYESDPRPDYITIFDGCRYSGGESDPNYISNLTAALRGLSGGDVEIFPEH